MRLQLRNSSPTICAEHAVDVSANNLAIPSSLLVVPVAAQLELQSPPTRGVVLKSSTFSAHTQLYVVLHLQLFSFSSKPLRFDR